MSAYSEAANGFVVSDRVTLMLNTMNSEARMRILVRAYDMFFKLDGHPLIEGREEAAAKAVAQCATEIRDAFKRRQKQSQLARQVGAERAAEIARPSHDNLTMSQERREEKDSPTPPIKEETKETSITPKPPRVVFTPPTVEEVKAYCDERKNGIDPQCFIDFYSAKGWMIGSNRMKDWRAAVRNWETRRRNDAWNGRGVGLAGKGLAGCTRTTTAGNFRGGTADQRAEAEAVL